MIYQDYTNIINALNSYSIPGPLGDCISILDDMPYMTPEIIFHYDENIESNCIAYACQERPLQDCPTFTVFYNFSYDSIAGTIKYLIINDDIYHIVFTRNEPSNSSNHDFQEVVYVATQSHDGILIWCPTFLFLFKCLNYYAPLVTSSILNEIYECRFNCSDIYNVISKSIDLSDITPQPILNLETCFTVLKEIMLIEDVKYPGPNALGGYKVIKAYEDLFLNDMDLDTWLALYSSKSINSVSKISEKQDKASYASVCLEKKGYINMSKFDLYLLRNEQDN